MQSIFYIPSCQARERSLLVTILPSRDYVHVEWACLYRLRKSALKLRVLHPLKYVGSEDAELKVETVHSNVAYLKDAELAMDKLDKLDKLDKVL